MGLLVDYCLLNIYAAFQVKETGQKWNGQDRFSLSKPELTFNMSDKLIAGNDETVNMYFTNPLAVPLTNCKVMLECSGAVWPMIEKVEDVGAGEVFNHTMTFKPRKQRWGSSAKTLVVVFSSEELNSVNGSVEVDVHNK